MRSVNPASQCHHEGQVLTERFSEYLKVKMLVAQFCLLFCDPMDCSLPDSSVHGVLQARILEWIAIPFSRESSWPRDQTWVSNTVGIILYHLSHQGSQESNTLRPFLDLENEYCDWLMMSALVSEFGRDALLSTHHSHSKQEEMKSEVPTNVMRQQKVSIPLGQSIHGI